MALESSVEAEKPRQRLAEPNPEPCGQETLVLVTSNNQPEPQTNVAGPFQFHVAGSADSPEQESCDGPFCCLPVLSLLGVLEASPALTQPQRLAEVRGQWEGARSRRWLV